LRYPVGRNLLWLNLSRLSWLVGRNLERLRYIRLVERQLSLRRLELNGLGGIIGAKRFSLWLIRRRTGLRFGLVLFGHVVSLIEDLTGFWGLLSANLSGLAVT
jgi:hypothetical protein